MPMRLSLRQPSPPLCPEGRGPAWLWPRRNKRLILCLSSSPMEGWGEVDLSLFFFCLPPPPPFLNQLPLDLVQRAHLGAGKGTCSESCSLDKQDKDPAALSSCSGPAPSPPLAVRPPLGGSLVPVHSSPAREKLHPISPAHSLWQSPRHALTILRALGPGPRMGLAGQRQVHPEQLPASCVPLQVNGNATHLLRQCTLLNGCCSHLAPLTAPTTTTDLTLTTAPPPW